MNIPKAFPIYCFSRTRRGNLEKRLSAYSCGFLLFSTLSFSRHVMGMSCKSVDGWCKRDLGAFEWRMEKARDGSLSEDEGKVLQTATRPWTHASEKSAAQTQWSPFSSMVVTDETRYILVSWFQITFHTLMALQEMSNTEEQLSY